MSQRGIRIDDWFAKICLGIFFFCIGAIFLSLFITIGLNTLMEDPLGSIVLLLITTAFLDVGLLAAVGGWKGRGKARGIDPGRLTANIQAGMSADGGTATEGQQKAIRAISGGMSLFFILYTWIQRVVGVVAAIIAILAAAYFWLPLTFDLVSGKASVKESFFVVLGLVLVSYVVIVYLTLIRKPKAD